MAGRKQSGSPLPPTTRLGGVFWLLPLVLLVLGACPDQAQARRRNPAPTCPHALTAANKFGHLVVLIFGGGRFQILNTQTKVLTPTRPITQLIYRWPASRPIDALFSLPHADGVTIAVSGRFFYKVSHRRVVQRRRRLSRLYPRRYRSFGRGVDAITVVGTTVLSFRGCHVLVGHAFTLSLPDIGLPCGVDAAWTDADHGVVVVKGPFAYRVTLHGRQANVVPFCFYCR